MSDTFIIFIIVFGSILGFLTVIFLIVRHHKAQAKKVKESSALYKNILELNEVTKFNNVRETVTLNKCCGSKREFDRSEIEDLLIANKRYRK